MKSKEKKDKIIYLRFEEHMKPIDIAKEMKVSCAYVTKVIKKDKRYVKEREKQKKENKQRSKEKTKKIIYEDREMKRQEYEVVKLQHIQAVKEFSYEVATTTDNYRKYKV